MKKLLFLGLALLMCFSLVACSTDSTDTTDETNLDKLTIYFVPSRTPEEIVTATEPLKALLKEELAKEGYEVGEVEIQVGTTYEAVGEALSAGTADVGFIPGGTYTLYDDGVDVLLTSTRNGLSKDSSEAIDWNDGLPTEDIDGQVTYYKGLIIAGPSEKGQELLAKVNAGEELTWEDLSSAKWGVRSTTSSSGYIYPSLWLNENFGHPLTDLPSYVQTDSYGSSLAQLAAGQVDVVTIYADARKDNVENWATDYGQEDIWTQTGVIGVTENIYNDTISVRNTMSQGLRDAFANAMINIAATEEGQEIISVYSHKGYQYAESSDYDAEREAQQMIQDNQ